MDWEKEAYFWKRKAEELELELDVLKQKQSIKTVIPLCKWCRRNPGCYDGICSECLSERDL